MTARRAIVAIPPWLSERIWWDPPLPRARAQLIQRVPTGQIYKIHLVYDAAFWRDDGLSGQTLDSRSPVPLTIDACGPEARPGILCVLAAGRRAYELGRLTEDERRRTVIDEAVKRFGERARAVEEYIEQDWAGEAWTGGGMITHFPPACSPPSGPLSTRRWARCTGRAPSMQQ